MSELNEITALMLEIIESKLPAPSCFNLWFGTIKTEFKWYLLFKCQLLGSLR